MTTLQTDTWYRVLDKVRLRIGSQRFEMWFKHTEPINCEDHAMEIGAPNLFVAEWLQTHFASIIAEIIKEESGATTQVRFKVSPELFQRAQRERLADSAEIVTEASARAAGLNQPPRPRQEFMLDNFVVGPGSRLAHACAMEIASSADTPYNPLFLHSDCGLGKTHLLHGIWNAIKSADDGRVVEYVTAEAFTNEFIYAMSNKRLDAFRARYRKADVLLIDDVNFFNGKTKTQEELLHTFDALHTHGRRIVLASDTHPKKFALFRMNLVSRFVSGMIACIESPDAATRMKILAAKALKMRCRLSDDVLRHIAAESRGSVRDLEGALNSIAAYSSLCNRPADVNMAREALRNASGFEEGRAVGLDQIVKVVAERFSTSPQVICSAKRTRTASVPRHVCMYLARRITHVSCADIAAYFGRKHRTTVIFADKRVQQRMASDTEFKALVSAIESRINT